MRHRLLIMTFFMMHKSVILTIALLAATAAAQTPQTTADQKAKEGPAVQKAKGAIAKHYKDPIIEQQDCPFPGVLHFSAFERANLAEDPIVPRHWYVTPDGGLHDDFPLDTVRRQPAGRKEARTLATWLFQNRYRWSRDPQVEVTAEEGGRLFVIHIQAMMSLSHPMFGAADTRRITAVVRVRDGAWSMSATDSLTPVRRKKGTPLGKDGL